MTSKHNPCPVCGKPCRLRGIKTLRWGTMVQVVCIENPRHYKTDPAPLPGLAWKKHDSREGSS